MPISIQLGNNSKKDSRPWKGWGLGAFGLFAACAGCCLAPLIGAAFLAGAGSAIAGWLLSWPILTALLMGLSTVLLYSIRKARPASCCDSPGSECGDASCGTTRVQANQAQP